MIKIESTQVFGWEAAIRGARNPMNSWEKSDSTFLYRLLIKGNILKKIYRYIKKKIFHIEDMECIDQKEEHEIKISDSMSIGPADHKLLMNLCKGGTEEAKWRRMIHVQMDVTAPLYWWKEFETYKVGTVSNSCSTMHKIHEKEFTLEDFSHEHIQDIFDDDYIDCLKNTVSWLNQARNEFLETKDKKYWWQMIQLLPSSYDQTRTVDLNYEVLASQYRQRKNHKLDEWHQYCDWIKTLPYSEFITMEEET